MSKPCESLRVCKKRNNQADRSSRGCTLNSSESQHTPPTSGLKTSSTATVGRSEMEEQEDDSSSKLSKSPEAAESGSVTPTNSKEQRSTPETGSKKIPAGGDAPQLHKWVYQTSQHALTLAEILEKSKWEGGCGESEKNGG
jgi:hypothetical protein